MYKCELPCNTVIFCESKEKLETILTGLLITGRIDEKPPIEIVTLEEENEQPRQDS